MLAILGTILAVILVGAFGGVAAASDYDALIQRNPTLKWYAPLQDADSLSGAVVRGGAPTWGPGPDGQKATIFDGTDHLTWGPRPDLGGDEVTVELWFSPGFDAMPYNPCLIAMRKDGNHQLTRWSIHLHGDRSAIDLWNGRSVAQYRPVTGELQKGKWYHLAVTSGKEGTVVYLNGVPCVNDQTPWTVNTEQRDCPLNLASSQPSGAERFTGGVAHAAVYAGILKQDEIAAHTDALGLRETRLAGEESRRRMLAEAAAKEAALEEAREKRRQELMQDPALFARGEPTVYEGEHLTAIDLPVGGIGVGAVHFDGTGRRHAWQIFGNVAYRSIPNSFFAVRAKVGETYAVRALQTIGEGPLPGMKSVRLHARYPLAEYVFEDDEVPCHVSMEVYGPFIPLNAGDSAIPCAIHRFHFRNPGSVPVEIDLLATQLNAVGYRGDGPIEEDRHPSLGGNVNRILRRAGATWLVMDREGGSGGDMVLAVNDPEAAGVPAWNDLNELASQFGQGTIRGMEGEGRAGPSPEGRTLRGAIAAGLNLAPGETKTLTVILAWYFPDLPAGQGNWGGKGRKYESVWRNAVEVTDQVLAKEEELYAGTRLYVDTLYDSNLPYWLLDRIANQTAILRSGTVFWTKDDYFGGWEGCNLDAGCCKGNCNHVWHYAQAHARLFPSIARLMRQQEFRFQKPDGAVPHRQPDSFPAFDGQCGAVLNSYREHLMSPDDAWLQQHWSHIRSAMEYLIHRWDSDENGVPSGPQWNTLDGELGGSSSWLGSLYLAALRAAEEMARRVGDGDSVERYRRIFRVGAAEQDRTLFNGHYYIQIPEATPYQDYGDACGIDQVLGQWWAWQLDLGAVYPEDHVRSALSRLFLYNFRGRMEGLPQRPRKFVADEDAGMQMFVWPAGTARPAKPIQYADEVMSGFEYSAAAAMVRGGLLQEGFTVTRAIALRYDGKLRQGLSPGNYTSWGYSGNPFGDDECGKFYARAMSSWSLLTACQGLIMDGPAKTVGFLPVWRPEDHVSFFTGPEGWGLYRQTRKEAEWTFRIEMRYGVLDVGRFIGALPPGTRAAAVRATVDDQETPTTVSDTDGRLVLLFPEPLRLEANQRLDVTVRLGEAGR
ncbi:GH116 family glycosyl-hydrolase [Thermopirellula anaerolimosa]